MTRRGTVSMALGVFAAVLCTMSVPASEARAQEIRFEERHPLGSLKTQCKRFGWKAEQVEERDPHGAHYLLEEESFEVIIPKFDTSLGKPGLLVWLSPTRSGREPPGWKDVLARHRLIFVGANDAGNDRRVFYRCGLALDAVHNVQSTLDVDEDRIYVAGFSGGGRIASQLTMHYADVFQGGIYIGGCNYFRNLKNPEQPDKMWPARFPPPKGKRLKWVRDRSRHVLCAGESDYNLEQSRAIAKQLQKKERFDHVSVLEMPGKAHEVADAEWLEKAIELLDAPLRKSR